MVFYLFISFILDIASEITKTKFTSLMDRKSRYLIFFEIDVL
jgi:hypothetical protein